MAKPDDQLDIFRACYADIPIRDQRDLMERPFFSLAKTPRINDWLALLDRGMKSTLAELLAEAIDRYTPILASATMDREELVGFMDAFPSQVVVLATQAAWTTAVEASLANGGGQTLQTLFEREVQVLGVLAETVLGDLEVLQRKKCEQVITECVHQRDTIEKLVKLGADSATHYLWQLQMRYVYRPEGEYVDRLHVRMANARLSYGFEYLGVPDRLRRRWSRHHAADRHQRRLPADRRGDGRRGRPPAAHRRAEPRPVAGRGRDVRQPRR